MDETEFSHWIIDMPILREGWRIGSSWSMGIFSKKFLLKAELWHVPPTQYVEAVALKVTGFDNRAFKEVIKVKWWHKDGALFERTGILIWKGCHLSRHLGDTRDRYFFPPLPPTGTNRGKTTWGRRVKARLYKPGREVLPEINLDGTLIFDF